MITLFAAPLEERSGEGKVPLPLPEVKKSSVSGIVLPPSNARTAIEAAGAPTSAWRATFKERVAREGGDVSLNPSAVVGKVQGMLRELKPEDICEPPAGGKLRNFQG